MSCDVYYYLTYVFSKYYLDRLGVRSFVIAIDIWNEVCSSAQARGLSDSTAQHSCVHGTNLPLLGNYVSELALAVSK